MGKQSRSTSNTLNGNDSTGRRSNYFCLVYHFMVVTLAMMLNEYYCGWQDTFRIISGLMKLANSSRSVGSVHVKIDAEGGLDVLHTYEHLAHLDIAVPTKKIGQ